MKIEIITDSSLANDDIQIEIRARENSPSVKHLVDYLNRYSETNRNLLPIKTPDRIITIKYDELIKVEVQAKTLTFYTTKTVIKTTGRLYQILKKLNKDFVQVSRHSIVNINYLESIEEGFAGNMIAILINNLKTDVSRRYLPELERELGI